VAPVVSRAWSIGFRDPEKRRVFGEATARARAIETMDGLKVARESGPSGLEDAALVELTRKGDAQAFGRLVRRHLAVAFSAARSLVDTDEDAEDVCQDAFIKALERIEECREPSKVRAWLLTIVRNRAHNYRKYQRIRNTEALDPGKASSRRMPDGNLERTRIRERTQEAAEQLTELQRSVLMLHDYEGWKHVEIGERLGISEGGSRFHLHAARKKMRTLLADLAPDSVTPGPNKKENER